MNGEEDWQPVDHSTPLNPLVQMPADILPGDLVSHICDCYTGF